MNQTAHNAGLALLKQHALIAGEPILANGSGIAVDDPATGEIIGHVPKLGASETEQAIRAADEAFPAWSQDDPHARGRFLRDWAGRIDAAPSVDDRVGGVGERDVETRARVSSQESTLTFAAAATRS